MKYLLIVVLLLSALSVSMNAFAEQNIIFCAESIKARGAYQSICQRLCSKDCGLDGLLKAEWKIDTTTAKDIPSGMDGCTCVGVQYVLSKGVPVTDNNTELLKKEIELLKKENEMLKKENDTLKAKGKKKK